MENINELELHSPWTSLQADHRARLICGARDRTQLPQQEEQEEVGTQGGVVSHNIPFLDLGVGYTDEPTSEKCTNLCSMICALSCIYVIFTKGQKDRIKMIF